MRLALFNHQRYDRATQQALLAIAIDSFKPLFSLLLAAMLVAACASSLPIIGATLWLLGAIASTVIGTWYCRYWRQRLGGTLSLADLRKAERHGVIYGSSVALVWGSSSQLIMPGHEAHTVIIAMIYFGVCAGAATLSVLGMAHMGIAAVIACSLFVSPLAGIFPDDWIWLTALIILYHLALMLGSWQRHQIVAGNQSLRQKLEQLLLHQRTETDRANKANQDKSAFLAAASHDLRQPVHAIMLLGHALQMKITDNASRSLLEQMLAAGKALSDQFNSLMELSRLESGSYPLNLKPLRLDELLERKLKTHEEIAASQGIRLRLRLDRRLTGQLLTTDPGLFNRIIDNLLDNALKFSPTGSAILITARQRQGRLQLGVHDQGPGIPESQQENVFLPHVQLDNPTRDRARGIGLGLSIVREAVQLLDAELTLHSPPGRGCCFRLTLPATTLTRASSATLAASSLAGAASAPPADQLSGQRLLIVEDDAMVADAFKVWANARGLLIHHHASPDTVPADLAPDLIICDIRLPGSRDGIDWLSQWLESWPEAGGILVSGEVSGDVLERAEQEGLMLLSKPVDPDILLQTLVRLRR